jgi:rhamnosyltransferase
VLDNDFTKILVLMTVYNGDDWVLQQIDSILNQDNVNVKLVLSDDQSTDKSLQTIKSHYQLNNNVEILTSPIRNGSAGQHFFSLFRYVNVENFDYIALSDQDDIWLPGKLFNAVAMLSRTRSGGYSCASRAFWNNGQEKVLYQSSSETECDFLFEGAGQGCTFVLTKDLFLVVQNFCINNKSLTNKFYYHDWLIYIISRSFEFKWFFEPTPFILYRQHQNNDTGALSGFSSIKSRLMLIKNGWYVQQIKTAVEIYKSNSQHNEYVNVMTGVLLLPDSFKRRGLLAYYLAYYGRRKVKDRIVLMIAALAAWI